MAKITPEEKARKLIRQLIVDQEPMTSEEQAYLIQAVKLPEVRTIICDLLFIYSSPHQLNNETCFQQLGFILRAILDIII